MKKSKQWKQQRHIEAKQRKAAKRRAELKRRQSGKKTKPKQHRFTKMDLRAIRLSMPSLLFAEWLTSQGRRVA